MTGKPVNCENYDCERATTIMEDTLFPLKMKIKYMKLGMMAIIPFFCIGMLLWRLRMDVYMEQIQKQLNANNPAASDIKHELAEKTLNVEVTLMSCEDGSHLPSSPSAKKELPQLRRRFRLSLKPLIGESGFQLVAEQISNEPSGQIVQDGKMSSQ